MKCRYEHDSDCCHAGADQYMCKCKQPCEFIWPMSNADHIRSLSDEELAEWLCEITVCECCRWAKWTGCEVRDWLKQPYKEDT